MFEVKLNIVRDKKDSREKDTCNYFTETLSGFLQIMRLKSENISLTDKYEFFRFLPINRNNLVNS
jgi:hypothetical protein